MKQNRQPKRDNSKVITAKLGRHAWLESGYLHPCELDSPPDYSPVSPHLTYIPEGTRIVLHLKRKTAQHKKRKEQRA